MYLLKNFKILQMKNEKNVYYVDLLKTQKFVFLNYLY